MYKQGHRAVVFYASAEDEKNNMARSATGPTLARAEKFANMLRENGHKAKAYRLGKGGVVLMR